MSSLARAAIALVWLYHGLWCKLLGGCPDQAAVVAALPGVADAAAHALLLGLGAFECALAVWVLSGRAPRRAAAVQTALLLAMNGGGLLWGRGHISAPGAMLVQNLALIALVWMVARDAGADAADSSSGTAWSAGRFESGAGPPALLFGRMHEDWTIEAEVLPRGGKVLCIASAGCTAIRPVDAGAAEWAARDRAFLWGSIHVVPAEAL